MSASSLVWAYLCSTLIVAPITWAWSRFLFLQLDRKIPPSACTERIEWIPFLVGIVERAIVTTLMIWTPKIVPTFIGGWLALKVAGGWGLLKDPTTRNRAVFFIGLLGNVLSLSAAIAVGLYVAPEAIAILNKSN